MAVRNLYSLGKTKPIPVYVWIPPIYDAIYKIEVIRSDGTVDDITDYIYSGEVTDGVTNQIGNFSFTVDNSNEQFKGTWVGNEIVKVYIDYATEATILRFRGRIENVSYQNNIVKIIGRSEAAKLLNTNASGWGVDAEVSYLLRAFLSYYVPEYTQNNINTTSTNITYNVYQKPLLDVIQELCEASGFDFYVDANLDCHFFQSGSVKNTTEAVVHDMNVFSVDDFADDYSQIKNVVKVEGNEIDSLPLIYTAKDTGSNYGINSPLGTRELVIKDENITTMEQAKERAETELARNLYPRTIGEIECKGLATIQPGEQIRISAPDSNLPPGYYTVISYTHKFIGEMRTILRVSKEATKIPRIIKERILKEKELKQIINPNNLEYSWNFDFDTDSGTHSNTEITDGILKLQSGASSGIWISDTLTLSSNVSAVECRLTGTALAGIKVYLSTDGGNTYTQIWGLGTGANIPVGKNLKLRVVIPSSSTQIESMVLLYSL